MAMGPMKSLTYTSHYEFSPDGTALVLSNYSYISGESHQVDVVDFHKEEKGFQSLLSLFLECEQCRNRLIQSVSMIYVD